MHTGSGSLVHMHPLEGCRNGLQNPSDFKVWKQVGNRAWKATFFVLQSSFQHVFPRTWCQSPFQPSQHIDMDYMPLLVISLNSHFGTCLHRLAVYSSLLIISKLAELDWSRSDCSPHAPRQSKIARCTPSFVNQCFTEHCSVHLNRAEATSLLMLISKFNRVKKFTKLEDCERFRCNYCVEPSLPCPVSRQHPNKSSTNWQGGTCWCSVAQGEPN